MSTTANRFKVLENVWVMHNDKPKEMMVYAVIEQCPFWGSAPNIFYALTHGRISAGVGWNKETRYDDKAVFPTKEALIKSLK